MRSTIKSKLFFGITTILLVLFFTLFYVVSQLSSLNNRMTNIVDVAANRIVLSNELMFEVMDITRNEKNIIIERDAREKVQYEIEINKRFNNINKKLRDLEETSDSRSKKITGEFVKSWSKYKSTLDDIIKLVNVEKRDEAFVMSSSKAKIARTSVVNLLNEIIDFNKERMVQDKLSSQTIFDSSLRIIIALVILSILLTGFLTYWIISSITSRIHGIAERSKKIASRELTNVDLQEHLNDELTPISKSLSDILESFQEVAVNANEIARGDYGVKVSPKSEKDFLGIALNKMSDTLSQTTSENERYIWLTKGQNLLNEKLRGDQSIERLVENAIAFLCEYTGSSIGALYLMQDSGVLHLTGRFAFSPSEISKEVYSFGEGLPGQAAVKNSLIHLSSVKQESLRVTSAILDAKPEHILVVPFSKDEKLLGVVELGKMQTFLRMNWIL
jgi:CHASE3 domain sensor protein